MSFSVELKVPADRAFVPLVGMVAADAAQRADLDEANRNALRESAELGFSMIVRDAMTEAREPIRMIAAATREHVRISLFERGLPLDDRTAMHDPVWAQIADSVGEAHWRTHGAAGSELQLLLRRPHGHPLDAPPRPAEDPELAPAQNYAIRRFRAEDGPGVARAFYLTYGYHYDFPAVYVPARLAELNARNRYISIVAVAENGEIAGHYALDREGDGPIADACGAVVVPAHRGRDLLNRLRGAAENEARRMGLAAYFSEPVTDHGRTQHASESFGAKACGVTLGMSPQSFLATHMELSTTTQRQSFMLYVKRLAERERRAIYVPAHHRAIIERIYAQLEVPVDLRDGASPQGPGSVRTAIARSDGAGFITVERVGTESADVLRQAAGDLRGLRKLGALFVSLPLEDPGTPQLCESLEEAGFFFSGVGPWMLEGGDSLRLQMPLTRIDLSALTVVGEFGRELLAYIDRESARVR